MGLFEKDKPFECAYCSNYYVSKHHFILVLRTGEEFGICEKCKNDIVCERCGKKLKRNELYVEECSICDRIYLTCSKCRTFKLGFFPGLVDKLKRIIFEFTSFGTSVRSNIIQCCVNKKEKNVLHTGIIYLKKVEKKKNEE